MDFVFIASGILSFCLIYSYDLLTVCAGVRCGRFLFPAGAAGLTVSTLLLTASAAFRHVPHIFLYAATAALFFAALLVYTLFFALPSGAYSGSCTGERKVCRTGMYALCRHPGMLWFTGFYLCMSIALDSAVFWLASAIFILMNYVYILMQDIYIFPLQFSDYDDYKSQTSFVIPRFRHMVGAVSDRDNVERSSNEI